MNDILYEILKSVVVLVLILITRYAIPYLKQKAENSKYDWVVKWVDIAVKSTEQTIFGDKMGPERKAIVTRFIKKLLLQKNIALSDEQLDNIIESAVFAMKNKQ